MLLTGVVKMPLTTLLGESRLGVACWQDPGPSHVGHDPSQYAYAWEWTK